MVRGEDYGEERGVTRKPGSVLDSHLSWPDIADRLCATYLLRSRVAAGRSGPLQTEQLGFASDGVCRAPRVTAEPVSSYLAFSPLPRT